MTPDTHPVGGVSHEPLPPPRRTEGRGPFAVGLAIAVASALSFATSGPFGAALQDAGWSAGAATLARIGGGALLLGIPTVLALRGRWRTLAGQWRLVLLYGIFAVCGAQLFFFFAVARLDVGLALMIEYLSPLLVVGWRWLRHGVKPTVVTTLGAALAIVGVMFLLDIFTQGSVDLIGVSFALVATVSATFYWFLSADDAGGIPPLAIAGTGLTVGAVLLGAAGALGVLPMAVTSNDVNLGGAHLPSWTAALGLMVFAAVLAYSLGVAAARRLGATLASFVALLEVVFAVLFAWLLLGQSLTPMQLMGGLLILVGVVVVKVGEH